MRTDQNKIQALVREILQNEYLKLRVEKIQIEEDLENRICRVYCELFNELTENRQTVEGHGVGFINAFFNGLKSRLAEEYPSLETIEFSSFTVRAKMETKKERSGTDAEGDVALGIINSNGAEFEFHHSSRSVIASGIATTLAAAEYFVNSERAFIATYKALIDAKKRRRSDMEQRFTATLAELVHNTSYTKVLEEIKAELGEKK